VNGRVIFIGTNYFPSEEKLRQLQWAQEQLHYSRITFLNTIKRESPFQQALAYARLKNMIKDRLMVILKDQSENEMGLD
jgi:hypothetical protein